QRRRPTSCLTREETSRAHRSVSTSSRSSRIGPGQRSGRDEPSAHGSLQSCPGNPVVRARLDLVAVRGRLVLASRQKLVHAGQHVVVLLQGERGGPCLQRDQLLAQGTGELAHQRLVLARQ